MKTFFSGLVCILVVSGAMGQSNSEPVVTPRGSAPVQDLLTSPDQKIPLDAPVITLQGVCDKSTAPADCKTVVTRAEFERVLSAAQPNTPKKNVAGQYAMALLLEQKAHDEGIDRTPEFEEQLKLLRLQLLARFVQEAMQKQAAQVSDADVEAYYKQHASDFQTLSFDKLYVPKQKSLEAGAQKPNDPDAQKQAQASEGAMKDEADKLRARAAAGEDFMKLQQEAYDFAGQKLKASTTRVDDVPKSRFPPSDASVFDLKAGEVSPVLISPQAYVIYKINAKKDQALADVHDEVVRLLQQQKMQQAFQEVRKAAVEQTKYNDAYFGVPAPPTLRNPGESPAQNSRPPAPPPPGKK